MWDENSKQTKNKILKKDWIKNNDSKSELIWDLLEKLFKYRLPQFSASAPEGVQKEFKNKIKTEEQIHHEQK